MCECNRHRRAICDCGATSDPGPKGPTPHKHAAVIKAWADGAKVEWKNAQGTWVFIPAPMWYGNDVYRIKPTLRPLGVVAYEEWGVCVGHHYTSKVMWQAIADAVVAAYKEQQNAN